MRSSGIFLLLFIIGCLAAAGCTQPSGSGPSASSVTVVTPAPVETTISDPPVSGTTVAPPAVTVTPNVTVTLVHYVSLVKDLKDSERLFSLQVPVEWRDIETYRLDNPENYEGFMYQTDLRPNNTFYIHTFSNYRSREQNYGDECKRWNPAPNATVVMINGLTFDRYESAAGGRTNVTYVMRQASMNDFGFLSILAFSADTTSNKFAVEDYDRVVQSFRYYPRDKIATMPGEEITFIYPDETSGNMRSAFNSGSSASTQSSSSSKSTCPLRRSSSN